MGVKVGKIAAVKMGTTKVAEMGQFTISGFSRETLEDTQFGDDIKSYVFGLADGGEVSFSGNYDSTDTTGQDLINSYCSNGVVLNSGGIRFYVDAAKYWTISGDLLITKSKAIAFDKAGIGTIDFTAKISGKMIYL